MELDWQFSRNMVIVREGERLIIINSVRLNEEALAELEQLGTVTDVIRLGGLCMVVMTLFMLTVIRLSIGLCPV